MTVKWSETRCECDVLPFPHYHVKQRHWLLRFPREVWMGLRYGWPIYVADKFRVKRGRA
jgi:hypothetical protein